MRGRLLPRTANPITQIHDTPLAHIHQLNLRFDAVEDRLILSISDRDRGEIRLLLTRRLTRLLLDLLNRATEQSALRQIPVTSYSFGLPAEVAPQLAEFQRESVLQQLQFSTHDPVQPPSHFPMGEQPILVVRLRYQQSEESLQIQFGSGDNRQINLNLDQKLMFGLQKLLADASQRAEWDLPAALSVGRIEISSPVKETILH